MAPRAAVNCPGWKFTPADLDDLLARIDRHQQQTTTPTIPQAA
jgi:hypothetical protein